MVPAYTGISVPIAPLSFPRNLFGVSSRASRSDCHSRESGNPPKTFHVAMKTYYVYILASRKRGTLYIGVTNDLIRRVYEHKNGFVEGFTKKYGVHQLVYLEQTNDIYSAMVREKQMKKWYRKWKIELIEKANPEWRDLYNDLVEGGFPLSRE